MGLELIVATKNRGKFGEIQEVLQDLPIHLIPLWELSDIPPVEENQPTFQENALKKAWTIFQATGKPTLADDSGLVVEALEGGPGVHTARYAGERASDEENIKKLLAKMRGVPQGKRQARYVCALALVTNQREEVVEESCEGEIAVLPQGSGGFGYDPIFWLPSFQKTMAELSSREKNRISHRGKALQHLRLVMMNFL